MSTSTFSSPLNVDSDVLDYIFGFLPASDQESCAKVCMEWLEIAGRHTLPLLDISDRELVHAIRKSPTVARYVRRIIAPINFDHPFHDITFIDRTLELPVRFERRCMATESLEFQGVRASALPPSIFMLPSIITFSTTLRRFALDHDCRMAPVFFYELLQALGQCKQLESLTLANPVYLEPVFLQSFRNFNVLAGNSLERPRLELIQLVSASHRERPRVHTANTADYAWLADDLCPFDLHSLKEIIAGSAAPMEVLLPTVKDSLLRLEYCCPFDTKESWSKFEKLRCTPIHLSRLRSLELHFLLAPSSCILDVVRAPMLDTFSLKWVTRIDPNHFISRWRDIDEKLSQLSPGQDYPRHLGCITLVHLKEIESPSAQWLAYCFRRASEKHINFTTEIA
ncbi:hypothetical protein BT96DRAFT_948442 [Gymnopus androsaceus JB14]|uniref:Uncharacterized protein n=1 Tax=Gymnopus androsaceus JB14 TaxID=1447944 RepID=A0A6A4GPZ6_9AGAR|nr:hypothetical protein BT96DRAFT_948442 [Gymnopus androsaceus JB14]